MGKYGRIVPIGQTKGREGIASVEMKVKKGNEFPLLSSIEFRCSLGPSSCVLPCAPPPNRKRIQLTIDHAVITVSIDLFIE